MNEDTREKIKSDVIKLDDKISAIIKEYWDSFKWHDNTDEDWSTRRDTAVLTTFLYSIRLTLKNVYDGENFASGVDEFCKTLAEFSKGNFSD